jgi:hypothetical protein
VRSGLPTWDTYQINVASFALLCVDVLDELVHVLEPGDGRVVLKVRPHRHHDVVRHIVLGLNINVKLKFKNLISAFLGKRLSQFFKEIRCHFDC